MGPVCGTEGDSVVTSKKGGVRVCRLTAVQAVCLCFWSQLARVWQFTPWSAAKHGPLKPLVW